MVQVSQSGSATDIPETCKEAYSPATFPGVSLSPARVPKELFCVSVKILFFPLLLRYLKILGFNLQFIFAEQKRKKYVFLCSFYEKKKKVHCLQLIGEQERRVFCLLLLLPGAWSRGWEGKGRLEQPLLLTAP